MATGFGLRAAAGWAETASAAGVRDAAARGAAAALNEVNGLNRFWVDIDDRPRLAKPAVNRMFGALKKKLTPTSGSTGVEACGRDMLATTLDTKPPITLSGRVIGKAANHNADAMALTTDFTASVKI